MAKNTFGSHSEFDLNDYHDIGVEESVSPSKSQNDEIILPERTRNVECTSIEISNIATSSTQPVSMLD